MLNFGKERQNWSWGGGGGAGGLEAQQLEGKGDWGGKWQRTQDTTQKSSAIEGETVLTKDCCVTLSEHLCLSGLALPSIVQLFTIVS